MRIVRVMSTAVLGALSLTLVGGVAVAAEDNHWRAGTGNAAVAAPLDREYGIPLDREYGAPLDREYGTDGTRVT
ncbi:hypothetical protein [Actinomadura rugatobispora]|uniref:Uncharacterized protein n=1 Tax=Actinomadura rugatobispora TaxID=1994 RepID=A0ABW0ZZ02_9ACTN|nr:hypothetical protein GCM10010200_049790 [Actinomadura rugatobispora]